ncbi:hypothetical protein NCCP2331_09610 [Sporosarcina sp. NCCP-2331]|nr:hypothetical protein NCCP2331_09610 [Sporosarcina sp. NCCP-2331]GLB54918.1 hypothetical protein NCCP2378_07030 [Sporosarcina sp. NCCP-2378]
MWVCSLNQLRRWGIALGYEPTGEEHASSLTATADPAVAPALVWGKYVMLLFAKYRVELVCFRCSTLQTHNYMFWRRVRFINPENSAPYSIQIFPDHV